MLAGKQAGAASLQHTELSKHQPKHISFALPLGMTDTRPGGMQARSTVFSCRASVARTATAHHPACFTAAL